VWEYVVAIAKDARSRGFDEINFDYIRFPTDGDLGDIRYPFWDKVKTKRTVIGEFFSHVHSELVSIPTSADIFGLATVAEDDLGIGQKIEDAYRSFDVVSPMIYPSHFANGFLGYTNPATQPYEVIKYTLEKAVVRIASSTPTADGAASSQKTPKLRPWLQVFDIGATYDIQKVEQQVQAVRDALDTDVHRAHYAGWLLWDPKNEYAIYR
jgi:hypothetical protein